MDDAAAPHPPLTAGWLVEVADRVPAGRAALDLLGGACHPAVAHHSARTLRYALDLADRSGADVDRDALVHACLLHDLGASALAVGPERFEVQGADLAVALLAEHGWAPSRREQVWAAIAVHTSPHVAERLSPLTRLVRLGVRADFGDDLVDPALRRATEADHPRLDAERVLSGVVVDAALRDGRRAPETSWAAALLAAHRASPDPDARLAAF
ncbi:HD domain-containing protein [Pseudokineococcus lusitanus]|uniref:HD domain-containing protein n=1 Tax=Pseudokineococcus lusitanus TaxID=763993 RepID=A0A3N1G9N7_9ACTN|nr:HD domain-containing protein [Pseudokineococcus lusitanus]ROP26921.1 HD domain-containing protein [Pseudokineococcus lusitanus]